MRNLMLPILCALFVFLSGMLIINWQLWHMARSNYAETAAASTRKLRPFLLRLSVLQIPQNGSPLQGVPTPDSVNWVRKLR